MSDPHSQTVPTGNEVLVTDLSTDDVIINNSMWGVYYKINIASLLGYQYIILNLDNNYIMILYIDMYVVLSIPNVSCGFW